MKKLIMPALLLAGLFIGSCKKKHDDPSPAEIASSCKVKTVRSVSTGLASGSGFGNSGANYYYDADGNISKMEILDSLGNIATIVTWSNYSGSNPGKRVIENTKNKSVETYLNTWNADKITKETEFGNCNSCDTTITYYSYDVAGNLISKVRKYPVVYRNGARYGYKTDDSTVYQGYSNGRPAQIVTYKPKYTYNSSTHYYEDQLQANYEYYTYDANGNCTKLETQSENGSKDLAMTAEFGNTVLPASIGIIVSNYLNPNPKNVSLVGYLPTKVTTYSKCYSSNTYSVKAQQTVILSNPQTNGSGCLTSGDIVTTYYNCNGTGYPINGKYTITY